METIFNWPTKNLGELAEFRNGVNYNKNSFGKGIKVVGVSNFQDYLKPRYDELEQINPEGIVTERNILRDGDIVFVRSNGNRELIGRSLFINNPPEAVTHSAFTIRLRFTNNNVFPRFFAYCFRTSAIRQRITAFGGGTNISNLNQDILNELKVPFPPLTTQRKIAAILSAYDDLIENNLRRIKILEEMAQNLYREWFVKFRFPDHEQARFVDSALGRIPEGWEVRKVGEILKKIKRETKIQKQDYSLDGMIPVIDQGKELIGGFTDDMEALISGDLPVIVFGDHTRILKYIDFPFACGADGTQLLKSNEDRIPSSLFYYALSAINLSNFAYARHFKFLKEETIYLPEQSIADCFDHFVLPLRDQIRVFLQKNATLRRTRDLLLPKLISGEVDVSELDITIPEEAVP